MNSPTFELDARLAADSILIADGPFSQLRLMNDARFPWLILVPRVRGATEWVDLDGASQRLLLAEINQACALLRARYDDLTKLNIGALGNIVRQLHIHVVGRREGDAAWPGPVWGSGQSQPYTEAIAEAHRLRSAAPTCGFVGLPASSASH
jgi:diadenosine tetraphosphate (Ap4A) HIT family hydrolase